MRQNRVKRIMREGGLAIVSHVGFADPAVIEIIAMAGFDGAFIDMEHTVFDLQLVGEMIRVADLTGITSIVRVPDNDAKLILRVLDMGAQGIQVPHIEGIEGARRAVNAVRYPPLGQRGGAGTTRAASPFRSGKRRTAMVRSRSEVWGDFRSLISSSVDFVLLQPPHAITHTATTPTSANRGAVLPAVREPLICSSSSLFDPSK